MTMGKEGVKYLTHLILLPGRALKAEVLNRAAKGYERRNEPPLIRGLRENFSNSMFLRMHFKPF